MTTINAPSAQTEIEPLRLAQLRIEAALKLRSVWLLNDTFGRWIIAEALDQLASEAEGTIQKPHSERKRSWRPERIDSPRLRALRAKNTVIAAENAKATRTVIALGAIARNLNLASFEVKPGRSVRFETLLSDPDGIIAATCRAEKVGNGTGLLGDTEYVTGALEGYPDGLDKETIEATAGAVLERALVVYYEED